MKSKTKDLKSKYNSEEKNSVMDTIKSMKNTKTKDLDDNSNFSYTVKFEDVE